MQSQRPPAPGSSGLRFGGAWRLICSGWSPGRRGQWGQSPICAGDGASRLTASSRDPVLEGSEGHGVQLTHLTAEAIEAPEASHVPLGMPGGREGQDCRESSYLHISGVIFLPFHRIDSHHCLAQAVSEDVVVLVYLACRPEPFFHPSLPRSVSRKLTPPSSSPFCAVGWFLTYISQWEAPVGDWRGKGGPGGLGCFLPVPPGSGTSDLTVSRSSVTIATPGATAPSSTGFRPFLLPVQA